MEDALGRRATNPRSAPSARALREATRGIRIAVCVALAIQFPGAERSVFENASRGYVGNGSGCRAYSSVGLERTPDKREVGGSNPPRPTSSDDEELRGAVAQLVER